MWSAGNAVSVVPAKAGTHNPFRCDHVDHRATHEAHGVWVPAFAGTTG